jgi:hypothetical protein
MGSPGPFRGELGEVTEGSIRTFCFIRWPGHVMPDTDSYAMFSIMNFFPTFASIIGAKVPSDRPIDGVDQTDVLLGKSEIGKRDTLLSFIGGELVASRWKQWRVYFTDVHPTGIGPQRQPGPGSASAPMAGYPKVFNIEMDQHEDLNVFGLFPIASEPALKAVDEYLESVKKIPIQRPRTLRSFVVAVAAGTRHLASGSGPQAEMLPRAAHVRFRGKKRTLTGAGLHFRF